jgi:hypothetical protein
MENDAATLENSLVIWGWAALGFWTQGLTLASKCSTTWALPPDLFYCSYFWEFLPRGWARPQFSYLHLPHNWVYRLALPHPAYLFVGRTGIWTQGLLWPLELHFQPFLILGYFWIGPCIFAQAGLDHDPPTCGLSHCWDPEAYATMPSLLVKVGSC